jgi:hypothetical protein
LSVDLEIRRETGYDILGRIVGKRDVELGDARFDSLAHVAGPSEPQIRDYLVESRRKHIAHFLEEHASGRIDRHGLTVVQDRYASSAKRIVETVNAMRSLADTLSEGPRAKGKAPGHARRHRPRAERAARRNASQDELPSEAPAPAVEPAPVAGEAPAAPILPDELPPPLPDWMAEQGVSFDRENDSGSSA